MADGRDRYFFTTVPGAAETAGEAARKVMVLSVGMAVSMNLGGFPGLARGLAGKWSLSSGAIRP